MMNEEKRILLDSVNRIELFVLLLAAALKKSESTC
jgi:hypothetical protein